MNREQLESWVAEGSDGKDSNWAAMEEKASTAQRSANVRSKLSKLVQLVHSLVAESAQFHEAYGR